MFCLRKEISSIITLICITLIPLRNGQQYTQYDQAESGTLLSVDYFIQQLNGPSGQSYSQTLNFQNSYNTPPKVLLGLTQTDIQIGGTALWFSNTVSSITPDSAVITAQKFGDTEIYEMGISYFVIENDNIQVQNFNIAFTGSSSYVKSFLLPTQGGKQRQAQCFLTGLYSTQSSSAIITYGISVINLTSTTYTIQITTTEQSFLQYFIVNCIEYYQETIGAYFMVSDSQLLSPGFVLTINNSPAILNAAVISNYMSNALTMFTAISSITSNQFNLLYDSMRVKVFITSYASNQQQIQASTWYQNQLLSLQLRFFDVQLYNCNANEPTNIFNLSDLNTCVKACPLNYYSISFQSALICKPCQSSCLTCNNSSTCSSCSQGYFIGANSLCQQCDASCLQCSISSTHCLSCPPNNMLINNVCYAQAGCDSRLRCSYCFNNSCIQCQMQNLLSCITPCPVGQYNLNTVCSVSQPYNTYCSPKLMCRSCTNRSCLTCSNSLFQCTSCNANNYLYLNNCHLSQPLSTYCDSSNICTACTNSACLKCDHSLNSCLACSASSMLYKNECYSLKTCNGSQTCQYCQNGICILCENNNPSSCS